LLRGDVGLSLQTSWVDLRDAQIVHHAFRAIRGVAVRYGGVPPKQAAARTRRARAPLIEHVAQTRVLSITGIGRAQAVPGVPMVLAAVLFAG
jgi:tRNA A37 threonylcarbamoyltransferase TsaD